MAEGGPDFSVDVLNSDFVTAYIEATGAPFVSQAFGADTCRQLGRDLSSMCKSGVLVRGRVGLVEHYQGMPNWVYVYRLALGHDDQGAA
ncbi:hypothetical protein BJP27_24405 (plasmid) [Pseudomonas oryzihabitans]|nr:hypothetical protein BJP27_24405 [Pseudomonas psychrotolerans]